MMEWLRDKVVEALVPLCERAFERAASECLRHVERKTDASNQKVTILRDDFEAVVKAVNAQGRQIAALEKALRDRSLL